MRWSDCDRFRVCTDHYDVRLETLTRAARSIGAGRQRQSIGAARQRQRTDRRPEAHVEVFVKSEVCVVGA